MATGYKIKEGKVQTKVKLEDSERVVLEKAACEAKGVEYPETYQNALEREFLYYKKLNPKSYYRWIDQVWRVLDERDGKEYITYHAYHYCEQTITQPDGTHINKTWQIDGYYGFYHDPIVKTKAFNADGSPADARVMGASKVYTIDWSVEAFGSLIDDPLNRGHTHQFSIGIAPVDGSTDVPPRETTQMIRNRDDFANHDYDTVMQLGRSQLSRTSKSMEDIKNTIALRQATMVNDTTTLNKPSPTSNNKEIKKPPQ